MLGTPVHTFFLLRAMAVITYAHSVLDSKAAS